MDNSCYARLKKTKRKQERKTLSRPMRNVVFSTKLWGWYNLQAQYKRKKQNKRYGVGVVSSLER